MDLLKIRPWPFKDRVVTLHWIGNVKMENNQWYIQVAFVGNSDCTIIELPVGVLPMLKIGVPYKDGVPLNTQKQGTYFQIIVEDLSMGVSSKAIDICRKFNIFLYKRPELMNQNMWSFKSEGITYHVPQVEVIRALFTPNTILANALLRPNGLDLLVNQSYSMNDGYTAYIDFADEIPSSIMSNDFARYFGWLYLNKSIKKSFESVQSNLYSESINHKSYYGYPLQLEISSTDITTVATRGIKKGDEVLILEILGTDNANPPFYELQCTHKSIKKYIYTDKPKKQRISKQEKDTDYILNEKNGEQSREDTHQPAIDLEPIQIAFRHSTVVTRIPKNEQKVNQGNDYISNIGRGGGVKTQIVGVDESLFGGKITPIEFKSMEIADTFINCGLDSFITTIQYLSTKYTHWNVAVNLVFLPLGRKFSYLSDGRRRICAIVKVTTNGKTSFIVEVAVPDNYSLSTLIIPSTDNLFNDETFIKKLLKNLIFKSGSWSTEFLNNYIHFRVKHTSTNPKIWGAKLFKYI